MIDVVVETIDRIPARPVSDLSEVFEADRGARETAREVAGGGSGR